jgi:hypothetical protein
MVGNPRTGLFGMAPVVEAYAKNRRGFDRREEFDDIRRLAGGVEIFIDATLEPLGASVSVLYGVVDGILFVGVADYFHLRRETGLLVVFVFLLTT